MIIGYTAGAFDLFHIGHVNILREAKNRCDKLIVGVSTDELVSHKNIFVPFKERIEIVRSCRYADVVIAQYTLDKFDIWKNLKFNILFVGDDWKNSDSWNKYEQKLKLFSVDTIYLPYTGQTSSTKLRQIINSKIGE